MALGKDTVVQTLLHERIRISGSVMPIVRDANSVDDLFQQVVLKALQTCDHFTEPDHLLAWALRIGGSPPTFLLPLVVFQVIVNSHLDDVGITVDRLQVNRSRKPD